MRGKRSKVVVGALGAGLGVMLILAASASARTRGFDIWNLTSDTLRVTNVKATSNPPGEEVFEKGPGATPPHVGQILKPGEDLHVELQNQLTGADRTAQIQFSSGGTPVYSAILRNWADTACLKGGNDPHQCTVDGDTIRFLDPPGSVHVVDKEEILDQRDALRDLCNQARECVFTPEDHFPAFTQSHVVGEAVTACDLEVKTTLRGTEKVATTNSVDISIEAGIDFFEIFKAGMKVKYGYERTTEHEFGQDIEVTIPEQTRAWVTGSAPVIRDVGTYRLNLGNTTWVLKNVAFDSPDPDPKRHGTYIADSRKLDERELKAACAHVEPKSGLAREDASVVDLSHSGDRRANRLYGWAESNTIRGVGGNDVITGGKGHDSLFGGSGEDWLNGGEGDDTLVGGPGPDHITDPGGPTVVRTGGSGGGRDWVDVRDRKGDDRVICESSASTVIADRGDRVDGGCGVVVRGTRVTRG